MTETPKTRPWTPEPWHVHSDELIDHADHMVMGESVDGLFHYLATTGVTGFSAENAANAARIVACVNAMAGIDDPAALLDAVDALVEAADGFLVESPKTTPKDGSVDTLTYPYSRGVLRDAIAAVRAARGEVQR